MNFSEFRILMHNLLPYRQSHLANEPLSTEVIGKDFLVSTAGKLNFGLLLTISEKSNVVICKHIDGTGLINNMHSEHQRREALIQKDTVKDER